jgi:hypothetical protein
MLYLSSSDSADNEISGRPGRCSRGCSPFDGARSAKSHLPGQTRPTSLSAEIPPSSNDALRGRAGRW